MVAIRILFALALATAPTIASARTASAASGPCASAQHRQFDFWVGKWDVYPTGANKLVAHSLIESVYEGCGVRENWRPLRPNGGGGSLNIYVPSEKAWRQTWIDSSGAHVDFMGGWNGKAMVLTGLWKNVLGPGKDAIVKMTYTRAADGAVRQRGETSRDSGKTWASSFDFIYRRAKS